MSELPTGWAEASVGDVAVDVRSGFASGRHNADAIGIPHLRPMNVSRNGEIDLTEVKYVAADAGDRRLSFGDVLFNNTNSPALVGKTAAYLSQENVAFSNHMTRIRLHYGMDPPFVARQLHQLWASGGLSHLVSNHVNQASIAGSRLAADVRIRVAPTAEQERIVAAIEEAFSKLDAGEAGLRIVRQLLKRMRDAVLAAAIMGRLVAQDPADTPATKLLADLGVEPRTGAELPDGWSWTTVGDLLTRIEAGKSFASLGRPAEPHELGVVKVSAMTWGEFRSEENKAIPPGATIDPRWVIRRDDLLFSRANTSEYVGACVVVPCDYPNLILSDKSLRLVPCDGVSSSWLLSYLRARPARAQMESLATGTKESMRNISQEKLRNIEVALPPTEEQDRVAQEIARQHSFLDACERAVDTGLARSQAFRRSVLKAAFEGKLAPQDPSDEPASALLERIRSDGVAVPKRFQRTRRTG